MAITSVAHFTYPSFHGVSAGTFPGFPNTTLDAAGEKTGNVFQAPKAGVISHLHFRVGTVTSAGNVDVRLETVDASTGRPSTTLWAANTNIVTALSSSNVWVRAALTAGATVAQGDLLAIVLANSTGNYLIPANDATVYTLGFPYGVTFLSSVWAKLTRQFLTMLEYNDTTYPVSLGLFPLNAHNQVTLNTGTTPDEAGNLFTAPGAMRAVGVWIFVDLDNTAEIDLYDSGGSVVASVTTAVDPDVRSQTGPGIHYYYFTASVTLTAGAQYRLIFKPTSGSSAALLYMDVDQAGYMSALPGGTDMVYTSRTDAGAWGQTTTRRAQIGLIIDGIDFGSAAGGLMVHPGMAGGMRG